MIVLDASAVLAMLFGEAGGDAVAEVFADAAISAVNLAEVLGKLADLNAGADRIDALSAELRPLSLPFGADEAAAAAGMRAATRALGLSLGDRACLATALLRGAPVMTADRAWAGLDLGVELRVIR